MKRVLVLYYSQSGQLERSVKAMTSALHASEAIQVDYRAIEPVSAYPYPWPFYAFLDAFPESVYMDGCEVKPVDIQERYDLIVLGYTSWFLSPSIPVTGFLKSAQAKSLFNNTPVVTMIVCRDMWIMAQEKMKKELERLGARLIDNIVLTDQGRSLYTFITTPRWMFTGRQTPFWFFPPAGVASREIADSSRFGERLKMALLNDEEKAMQPLLKKMGAVDVQGKLIAAEKIGHRSFLVWGKLIKLAGEAGAPMRKVIITLYAAFLVLLILTVVPLTLLIRRVLYPFQKEKIAQAKAYYEEPSGY